MLKMDEDDLTTGIFDKVLSDTGLITYTVPEKAEPIEWKGCNELQQFLSKLKTRKIMDLPKLEELGEVKLSSEWEKFIEDLAKELHDVWAQSRMDQGWTYGPERNDVLKHHPCLVAYEDLPELEKTYDRDTAVGTLKLIQKLGFKITKE